MKKIFLISIMCIWTVTIVHAQRQMEYLNRGIYAINEGNGSVFVSWRFMENESADVGFNLYRTSKGKTVKLNKSPLQEGTNFTDVTADTNAVNTYFVKTVIHNREQNTDGSFSLKPHQPIYLSIPLRTPTGYRPNDGSVGDLDGDGQYEIIIHQTGKGKDNSQDGYTDPPIFQAYKLDGTFLWQINLGKNIREGAHYTQFMVYDLDGDGKAEIVMKTADGTIDGLGDVIGDSSKDYRNARGRILDGPEYLTVFDGLTGKALSTVDYIPPRGDIGAWGGKGGNGGNDNYGNRVDRFLACVAYLDGKHPSVVMCRGYYGRSVLAAWDFKDKKLVSRWVFDSHDGQNPFSGQGYHNLFVADVDHDGKDEIVYGSMCVDDNGKGLYTTGLRHGDAVHVSHFDPQNKDQLVWGIHEIENGTKGPGAAMYNARTGKILWHDNENQDVGRGLAADIDPRYPGYEIWGGAGGLKDVHGNVISQKAPRSTNFRIWWDGDLLSELLDGTHIDKWDWNSSTQNRIFDAREYNCVSNNGTKANPVLSADILGDWREEVIYRTEDNKELRIFSTTIPSKYRIYTLMHNPQYRLSVAWQNVGYNQPPYTDFYLGEGMQRPEAPKIKILKPSNVRH
ncbi:rhamnogalacturonan lyase [Arachidicoccus ginsenosidivorans]|uniref:Rhamnogalacturonan lyase n=1 Tax=Arachidicoccus ginsenosidivorans TaxID=496057 RepID=A0A5B8VMR1_9BACT|nr:rhamnogalacturonan lyase [Arachidicoccus ginsenosidivorans]QEC71886.1 rhamnogalacturonan lyase [Arachidicoccus ginsenosidivorans]